MSKKLDDDRISALPDALLGDILSNLPTKYAVATSILSRRWRYLSSSIPNIDIDESLLVNPQNSSSPMIPINFINFVFRVLLLRNEPHIHKFRLICTTLYDNCIISAWICAVIWRNIKELEIHVPMNEFGTLPVEILTCKTLETLKFHRDFVLNVPCSVNLPNLKVLRLDYIKLTDDESVRRVFSSCPLLEDLGIFKCTLDNILVLDISIPSLKKFTLNYCQGDYEILLDTPILENLEFHDYGARKHLVKSMNCLVRADINFGRSAEQMEEEEEEDILLYGQYVSEFIKEMHNVKFIYLGEACLEGIYFSHRQLPTFHNLTRMELGVNHTCGWLVLPELLQSSPNLQELIFDEGFIDYFGVKKEFEYRLPESVPVCLSCHLGHIKVGEFDGQDHEFELVEYFLKNAEVLKKMLICSEESSDWIESARERFLAFPRCSKTCEIELTWRTPQKIWEKVFV